MDSELTADIRDIVVFVVSAVAGFVVVITIPRFSPGVGATLGLGFFVSATYASWRLKLLALGAGVWIGASVLLLPALLALIARSAS